jgi:hypothetical protein
MPRLLTTLILLMFAAVVSAQLSVEEAQHRLQSRLATRPASTQPVSEVDRLRAENRRLRDENMSLTMEVAQLREALAAASGGGTAPSTQPSGTGPGLRSVLVGRWVGGDLTAGTAFTTEFADDGTYRQTWSSSNYQEAGRWSMGLDGTLQMWTKQTGEDRPGNRWRINLAQNNLTLTPLGADSDAPSGRPLLLHRIP